MEVSAGAGRIDEEPAMEFLAAHQAEMGHGHHVDGGEVASVKNRAALPRRGEEGQRAAGPVQFNGPARFKGLYGCPGKLLGKKVPQPCETQNIPKK